MNNGDHVNTVAVAPLSFDGEGDLSDPDVDLQPGRVIPSGVAAPLLTPEHHLAFSPPMSHRGVRHGQQEAISGTHDMLGER